MFKIPRKRYAYNAAREATAQQSPGRIFLSYPNLVTTREFYRDVTIIDKNQKSVVVGLTVPIVIV